MNKLEIKKRDQQIIAGLFLSLVLMWGGFFLVYSPNVSKVVTKKENQKIQAEKQKVLVERTSFFDNISIEARSYVVYDIQTGEIIAGRGEQDRLPLASITKVMTVLTASEQMSPNRQITINNTNLESNSGLRTGEHWSLNNLAAITLVGSSNDGAEAIAEEATTSERIFVEAMNQKARDLSLSSLHFSNPTGLDDGPEPGGKGSALDVAKLMAYIIKYKSDLLTITREPVITKPSLDNFNHTVINTNKIIDQIPGIIASKTGYTNLAGGNLAVVTNLGLRRPLAFVVLGSSQDGRFTDMQKLVKATTNYYAYINK